MKFIFLIVLVITTTPMIVLSQTERTQANAAGRDGGRGLKN